MTLIIYIKCADAVILVSDRKESDTSDVGQGIQKYYMPTNKEFVLGLTGESTRIGMIFSELHREQNITARTILDSLHQIIDKNKVNNVESMAAGVLLVRDGNKLIFHDVWCTDNKKVITKNEPPFKHYGDGSYLADYLIREFEFSSRTWEESYPYIVAIMDTVAARVDSVGSVDEYGVDLLVFTNDGQLKTTTVHNTNGIGKIKCGCDMDNQFASKPFTLESIPKRLEKRTRHLTITQSM